VYIVWPEPLLVAGPDTAINDAITLLDLENVAVHARSSYPRYSIEELIRSSPDVLVIARAQEWTSGRYRRACSESLRPFRR